MSSPSATDVIAAFLVRDATLRAVKAKVKEILESGQLTQDDKHRRLYALAEQLGLTDDPSFQREWIPQNDDEARG
jgi:hypothetical protein